MRNLCRGSCLALIFLLGGAVWSEPPGTYMPKGSGVVNGKASIVVLPRRFDPVSDSSDYLDPAGLEVHLVRADNPDVELAYPAASWFQPPPGRYRIWLQGGWRITPFSALMLYSGQATSGYMAVGMPVGEAGRVRLPPWVPDDSDLVLHLLYAGEYSEEGFARWELAPRRAATKVGEGVLMPEGKAVGLLWSRKSRAYVALSQPFEVKRGAVVEVPLERPGTSASLVAEVERRHTLDRAADLPVRLAVKRPGAERGPDLAVFTADKAYAVWYHLDPGTAELTGESETDVLGPSSVELAAGRIEHVAAQLKARPALDVQLDLPLSMRHEDLTLELRQVATGEVLSRRAIKARDSELRFERLPPALLEVELQTGLGAVSRQADLTSGEDGFLLLKPELITVSGTVYLGKEGHPATLTFAGAGRTRELRTGEDGRYEAVFLEPVQTVTVALEGVDGTPYFDFFRPALSRSKDLDFHLPAGVFRVSIVDDVTGKGIAGAAVDIRNSFWQERGRDEEESPGRKATDKNERAVFQSARADETGIARLPPLREGALEVRASAQGYRPQRDALKVQILDQDAEQTFEVRLEPVRDLVELRLRLPTGEPAVGAEVMLLDSLEAGQRLFSGRSDEGGIVRIPRQPAGLLLIRHPATAFLVRDWHAEEEKAEWRLPPASDRPLRVSVRSESGEGGIAAAELMLWVAGYRISGPVLGWLAGAGPMADSNGIWIGRNLPRTAVGVLARSSRLTGEEESDSAKVVVEYPWADVVEVRAVH